MANDSVTLAKAGRNSWFRTPRLTEKRAWTALLVAVVADALQFALGPAGWLFFDEIIDVVALIITSSLLGFHLLLLPTFLIELFPVVDMLPTWTACVALLIAMRKREQAAPPPPPEVTID